jgi:hypothetical protein
MSRPSRRLRVAPSRVRRLGVLVGAAVALALIALGPAGAVTGPVRVLDGPEDQFLPTVNDSYLIWTQNSQAHPNRDHAYGKRFGTSGRFRLNPAGTRGYAGGIDPGENLALYQQVSGGDSDLFRFDLDTRARRRLGAPLNTGKWERDPRISDAFIFFARDAQGMTSLFVFDRSTKALEKIASLELTRYFVVPGAVGERYVTWTVCTPFRCTAWVRDTDTDVSTKIPSPSGRSQYAPVVDEAGAMMYFVRSGHDCGASVGIWRRPVDLSTSAQQVVALPAGVDVGWTMSLDDDVAHARLDLWFSRFRCAPRQGDIYELRRIDVGP